MPSSAIVLMSGGLNSAVALHWARLQFDEVEALHISIGDTADLDAATEVCLHVGLPHINVRMLGLFEGSSPRLMSFDEKPTRRLFTSYLSVELIERSYREDFVPAEKLVYLSVALNIAAARGMECVVFGVSQYSTHPDCTLEFVDAFSAAAGLALVGEKYAYGIHTPLIQRTKKQIVELAGKLEGCMETLAKTTTCLNGGIPCLHCAACLRRAQGFHDAGVADPLIVALKAAGMLGRRVPDDGFIEVVEVDEDDEFPETTGGSTIDER